MNSSLHNIESLSQQLNDLYAAIRKRDLDNSIVLKEEIDLHFDEFQKHSDLALYYHLMQFRYNFLIDNLNISKNSFDIIDTFAIPQDNALSYYYHFFKAIYYNAIGNYQSSKEYYNKAKTMLKYTLDELEVAEFHYMFGYALYDTYKGFLALQELSKAKEIFARYDECETNLAFCNNLFGLAYTDLEEFELANKYYNLALNTFNDIQEETFILMVKQNLALMHAKQERSDLAIQLLSEVSRKMLNNYKALFVEAREYVKLLKKDAACERIERGLNICKNLGIIEYSHHFQILQALNDNVIASKLETLVLDAVEYFEKQKLSEYTEEYQEQLAHKYYTEKNYLKSCEYFELSRGIKNTFKKVDSNEETTS
ncbi:response regulator aspartate phosphatase [Bacillus sp. Fil]|uniref:response regulator aspartate phosphatase n=1 Tax=Bacillus sp. Fil TaxID=3459567 RepID=UPI00403A9721